MQTHDTKGFKVGDKIRIVEMAGEPHYNGRVGGDRAHRRYRATLWELGRSSRPCGRRFY